MMAFAQLIHNFTFWPTCVVVLKVKEMQQLKKLYPIVQQVIKVKNKLKEKNSFIQKCTSVKIESSFTFLTLEVIQQQEEFT